MEIRLLVFILSCLFISCQSLQVNDASKANVAIYVKYIPPGCGGAPPTQEEEKERFEGTPFALKEIALSSKDGSYSLLKTNPTGMLYLNLEEGEYCLSNKWKKDTASLSKVLRLHEWKLNQACYEKWQARCNLSFTVENEFVLLTDTVEIYGRCESRGIVPCIINLGELPQ